MVFPMNFCLILCMAFTTVDESIQSGGKTVPLRVQVVDSVTGKARFDVELFLQDLQWKEFAGPVRADRMGKAEFRVPPGNYILRAEGTGFTVLYGQLPDGMVQTVYVAREDKEKTVTFAVASPAVVSGIVHDELGEPVSGVQVQLYRSHWSGGATRLVGGPSAVTDDRGQYRITGIKAGAYVLCAAPLQHVRAAESGSVDFAQSERQPRRYYQRTCVPGEPVTAAPATLRMAEGEQRAVDLVLQAAPVVTVMGHVSGEFESASVRLVRESLIGEAGAGLNAYVQSNNSGFAVASVPPGRYRLEAQGHRRAADGGKSETLYGAMRVEVGGSDLEDVEVVMQGAAEIELAYEEAEAGLSKMVASVGLLPVGLGTGAAYPQSGDAGTRRFPSLREGSYWLETRTGGEGTVCITGARLGDRDVFREPAIVTSGMKARLTLRLSSTECASFKARVVRDGRPAPGARVVVLLRGTPQNPGDCWTTFTNSEGEFELWGIPQGRYLVWAWQDDDSGVAAGPADLAKVAPFASVVDARQGDSEQKVIGLLDLTKVRGK